MTYRFLCQRGGVSTGVWPEKALVKEFSTDQDAVSAAEMLGEVTLELVDSVRVDQMTSRGPRAVKEVRL